MKYNLSDEKEKSQALEYFDKLIKNKSIVEIKKCVGRRTYAQNNYLHLLLSICALEIGETLEFFKEFIWKRHIAKDIFQTIYINPKTNEEREDWRSSGEVDTHEMAIAIDRLLMWAAKEISIELPLATNIHELRKIENHIESNKQYL